MILSLLLDLALFFHPQQLAQLENKLPACTVGRLQEIIKLESLFQFARTLCDASRPHQLLQDLMERASHLFQPAPSRKHLVRRFIGRLAPTPALKYHFRHVIHLA